MTRPGPDFSFESAVGAGADGEVRRTRVRVTTRARTWPWLDVGLLGDHQAANAAVVVAAVEALRCLGLTIGDAAVAAGLAGVSWPARLEVVRRHPLVVLDCAHNVASVRALVEALARFFPPVPRLLVLGCSSDKDLPGMCAVLAPHFRQAFLTRYRDNPRAAAPEYLAGLLAKAGGPPSVTYPTPEDALAAAELAAGPDELICITGSVFLAGALRPAVVREGRPV